MKPGYVDLVDHVSELCAFVKSWIAAVVDRMTFVPTRLRHHDRLPITPPRLQEDFRQRCPSRVRTIIHADHVYIHC